MQVILSINLLRKTVWVSGVANKHCECSIVDAARLYREEKPLDVLINCAENGFGEYISYRPAKTALNQETITIAHGMKAKNLNITVLALDPGEHSDQDK
ncbi:hypothetical protein AJ80_02765 [Polytolypa hystricis UAMH7299]|uniref:Uncharacterized protein n=1 Tax=Polytolypa hystricis (strain UAMH7299) TaxID=1447883 RepID=A0A2B7YPA2_POLH7|nr:hypothetical protein AJ80_02765 [Polytolypa hystricis UAMH7299]